MSDFNHINEFRKGSVLRKINEDPTYLSFFLMFDVVDREFSPLLSGPAEDYLRNFVDANMGTNYADNLVNFKKVLMKINKEMPWFFQKVSGLELTQTYGKMEEPWRGAESPKIEIECLEENIELTAIGLMDLYKRSCYDYARYVEILPANLRDFRVWVVVSEVRTFQQDVTDRNENFYGSIAPENKSTKGVSLIPKFGAKKAKTSINKTGKFDDVAVKAFSAESMPFLSIELGFCQWVPDSIADMYADVSKMPELKKPKIAFTWNTAIQHAQKYGDNIGTDGTDGNLLPTTKAADGLYPNTPFNPLAIAQNAISDKVNGIADGLVNRFNNLKDSLPFGKDGLGNAYGNRLTGAAATLANMGMDKLKALLLANVYGANTGMSVLNALERGSINGIINLAGQLQKNKVNNVIGGNISEKTVYESGMFDSSPDGKLNSSVYDAIAPEGSPEMSPGRIYEKGIDRSPDGLLNDNVYE
jgi:hypothetical protein